MAIEFHRDGPWELPAGWVWARLGNACQINRPPSFDDLPGDLEIPFVPMAAVAEETGVVDFSRRKRVSELRNGYTRFQSGDVLFAKITPCMENGKSAALLDVPGCYGAGSTEFHTLRSQALDARYLWYWLVRKALRADAQCNMRGAVGQLRVPLNYLRDVQIAIPPFPEQRRIVARIDELFTEIADGEAALHRARADLDTWRRALLKALVTGGLTREWRERNAGNMSGADNLTDIRSETNLEIARRKHRALKTAPPSEEIKLPALPESWAWGQLGDLLFDIEAGMNVKAEGRPPAKTEAGIVKISAVTWDEFDETESKTLPPGTLINKNDLIKPGDLLISRANTLELVGAPVIVKSCGRRLILSDKVLRLRVLGGLHRWVELCLKSPLGRRQIEHYASGNQLSMRNITQDNIARLAIPLPPRNEIEAAIKAFEDCIECRNDGRLAVEDAERGSAKLRQSILKAAFEGRLVPQDPRDEPAERLLARLSEEREAPPPRRRSAARRIARAAE